VNETVVTDHFGRRTEFTGEQLIYETTDSSQGDKPQWLEVDVWRTEAGNFVVKRTTRYRIRHLKEECSRADGYELSPATREDTYACPSCNKLGFLTGAGFAQDPRITVDVYNTPQDLIAGFQSEGRFNNLARAVLADICEKDDRVDAAWNRVVVP